MNRKVKHVLTTENRFFGFRIPDLFGIVLMGIAILFCIYACKTMHQSLFEKAMTYVFGKNRVVALHPNILSTGFACVIYAAIIIRFPDAFRQNNLLVAIISSIRAFFNIWAIAAIISVLMPAGGITSKWFGNWQTMLLLFSVVMTWLGIRTLAGYTWFIYFLTAVGYIAKVNSRLGPAGYLFVMFAAISMFLQIASLSSIRDFANEFSGKANRYAANVGHNIELAGEDIADKARSLADHLDLNGDGKVDEDDFSILDKIKHL